MKCPAKKLPFRLEHHVNAYALAASAAGVGLMALAQPAEGKIVYTSTHRVIRPNHYYNLDLNHDGKVDFTLSNTTWQTNTYGHGGYRLFLKKEQQGNCSLASSRLFSFAAALPKGVRLSSKDFVCGLIGNMVIPSASGPWQNVRGRYLGLKFYIGKKIHYGWARLNVSTDRGIIATLTGYAYETIPGKSIIAGNTHGPDVITLQDASLGHLARGASAMKAWRQKEQ